jgi:hypothetical protein
MIELPRYLVDEKTIGPFARTVRAKDDAAFRTPTQAVHLWV